VSHPRHIASAGNEYVPAGQAMSDLGNKIGTDAVVRAGSFEDAMLRALDKVSGDQQQASNLIQAAITEPGSVDAHDITIAQAKAAMSLNITRTVLNRLVQSWKDLINTR
jgi:flagellar hook-basal body complex protein FliE